MAKLIANGDEVETPAELLRLLRQFDDQDFEEFVADLWEEMGWETNTTPPGPDEGLDVEAYRDLPYEQTVLIQAKRYGSNTSVGGPDIQQYSALPEQYKRGDQVVVVTTGDFTKQAKDLSERLGVRLVNGADLADLLMKLNAEHLVAHYMDGVTSKAPEYETLRPKQRLSTVDQQLKQQHNVLSHWAWIILGGTALMTAIWIGTGFVSEGSPFWTILVPIIIISYPMIIIGIFFDYGDLSSKYELREPRWLYVVLAATLVFNVAAGVIYLLRRYFAVQSLEQGRPVSENIDKKLS